MIVCEACGTQYDLLSCWYEDQPMLYFCHKDMIEHLEGAHPDSRAAQIDAKDLRRRLEGHERMVRLLRK